jgi:hypothetical protein
MLQGVEEHMEIESQTKITQKSVVFTPLANTKGINNTPHLNAEGGSRAEGIRSVLKVFMNNQMDLNQSELDYYEKAINDCIEKLECLEIELEEANQAKVMSETIALELQQKLVDNERLHIEQLSKHSSDFEEKERMYVTKLQSLEATYENSSKVCTHIIHWGKYTYNSI